jgi:hypothetical protein
MIALAASLLLHSRLPMLKEPDATEQKRNKHRLRWQQH